MSYTLPSLTTRTDTVWVSPVTPSWSTSSPAPSLRMTSMQNEPSAAVTAGVDAPLYDTPRSVTVAPATGVPRESTTTPLTQPCDSTGQSTFQYEKCVTSPSADTVPP